MRAALSGVVVLVCSACVADAPYPDALSSVGTTSAQLAQSVSEHQALATLPADAGRIVAVIERRTEDLVAQDIVLKEEPPFTGENKIAISIGRYGAGGPALGPELIPPPSSGIVAEMARELPSVAMQISASMAQNGYGPFGYATGMSGGKACIYAWQFVPGRSGLGRGGEKFSVSTRVRLCRQRATAAALVDIVSGLRISAAMPAAAPGGAFLGMSGGDALAVAQGIR